MLALPRAPGLGPVCDVAALRSDIIMMPAATSTPVSRLAQIVSAIAPGNAIRQHRGGGSSTAGARRRQQQQFCQQHYHHPPPPPPPRCQQEAFPCSHLTTSPPHCLGRERQCHLVAPLDGARFGARLVGADLCQQLSPAAAEWVTSTLWQHGVLVVPGQQLGASGLERLANHFGAPVADRFNPNSVQPTDGSRLLPHILRNEDGGHSNNTAAGWHADLDFEREPCTVTLLHCQVAPVQGGRTNFACTSAAYDALPADEQARLEALEIVHLPRPFFNTAQRNDPQNSSTHALIRPQPQTRRRAIYLPAEDFYPSLPERRQGVADGAALTGKVKGMRRRDSDALLRRLLLHSTQPAFIACHQWCEDDLVIWDNSQVLHRAEFLGVRGQGLRLLHRVSVKGAPRAKLPRNNDCDTIEWRQQHVRGYQTPLSVIFPTGEAS